MTKIEKNRTDYTTRLEDLKYNLDELLEFLDHCDLGLTHCAHVYSTNQVINLSLTIDHLLKAANDCE